MQNSSIGFFGLLALIFIGLKLAQVGLVAAWSWWWVLSPLWGPAALAVVIIVFLVLNQAVQEVWRR